MSVNFTGDLLWHRSIMTELILPEAIIHFKTINVDKYYRW